MNTSSEAKELFRATLSKVGENGEIELVTLMPENVLESLTEEQVEKAYIDIAKISDYVCNCIVANSKK